MPKAPPVPHLDAVRAEPYLKARPTAAASRTDEEVLDVLEAELVVETPVRLEVSLDGTSNPAAPPNVVSIVMGSKSNTEPMPAEQAAESTIVPAADAETPNMRPKTFLDIQLEGETDAIGSVKVFDNCATIRMKVKELLQTKREQFPMPGELGKNGKPKPWNQTRFADACGTTGRSLTKFCSRTGRMGGGTNYAYYGAYVFFEKWRIYNGKPKTKARLDIEAKFPDGLPLIDGERQHLSCRAGDDVSKIAREAGKGVLF